MKISRYWLCGALLALGLVIALLGLAGSAVNAAPNACATPIPKNWRIKGNCGTTAGTHFIGTTDNQALVFKTNQLEQMRIGTNGNVGIGTTAPNGKLHVTGNWSDATGYGALTLSGEKPTLRFSGGAASGNQNWLIHIGSFGPGNMEFFNGHTGAWKRVMSLNPNGNVLMAEANEEVGIGTTNPVSKLDVRSTDGKTAVNAKSPSGIGVFGDSDSGTGVNGKSDSGAGVFGVSDTGWGVAGNSQGTGKHAGVYGANHACASGQACYGVYSDGNFAVAPGYSKSALVETANFGERKMYSMESPENWFEDLGLGQLVNGRAVISIDPIFAQTVNLHKPYHVFLTPRDGFAELYVTNLTPTSFEVRDARGSANLQFDYRLIAKRLGMEKLRLTSNDSLPTSLSAQGLSSGR
jgi:hypothetical protein